MDEDGVGDGLQRQNLVYPIQLDSFLGHAEDDTGGFVLGDGRRACLFHFEHSTRAIVTHSSEDDADRIAAGVARRGTEEDVDGRLVATDQRAIFDFDAIARRCA